MTPQLLEQKLCHQALLLVARDADGRRAEEIRALQVGHERPVSLPAVLRGNEASPHVEE